MIASGYTRECIHIYKIVRKSVIDEALDNLGVERFSLSQIQKMDWEVLEFKIKQWLNAVKVAVKKFFFSERLLCDHVFSASPPIREACFAEISKEGAVNLFGFPESAAKSKKTPEKMFRMLDMYEAIANLWIEIDSIFTFESVSAVKLQAVASLSKLGEAVRSILTEFETAIQKDTSKSTVPGGGIHPLTRYVMNYLTFLADYGLSVADIVEDWPMQVPAPLPEEYSGSPLNDDNAVTVRFTWLILVLVCKIDGKAELYKDVAQSYLFLLNNLQYVITKVRTSNLKFYLGEEWLLKYEAKVKQYAVNYERTGWAKVFASLPENPSVEISPSDCFKKFNLAFEDAYKKQSTWIVSDPKLRDEIKVSVANRIVPGYTDLYQKYRFGLTRNNGKEHVVKFAPDDLGNYLSDLFCRRSP
jgi:exocyst complex protein 7